MRVVRACVCASSFACVSTLRLIVKVSLCQEPELSAAAGQGRVFTNQWWTNSELPASQTSLLLSGAPSAEQAGWAALISSVVLFFFFFFSFFTESHWGTCVCVWDAGMHGANPPLSSNAWTVSKTLLLLPLPSMLIRRGLRWGVRGVHRCNSRLTSQDS